MAENEFAKTGKRVARAGWTEQECSHIVPASQYPHYRLQKNIGEKKLCTLSHIGLKTAQEDVATWVRSDSLLKTGHTRLMSRRGEPVKHARPDIDRLIKTVTENAWWIS
jgi:hypothetical protein